MAEERVQRRLAAILAADGEGDELTDVVLVVCHPALLVVARVWGRYSRRGTESRRRLQFPKSSASSGDGEYDGRVPSKADNPLFEEVSRWIGRKTK